MGSPRSESKVMSRFVLCDFPQSPSAEMGKTVDESGWGVKVWNSMSKMLNLSCVE